LSGGISDTLDDKFRLVKKSNSYQFAKAVRCTTKLFLWLSSFASRIAEM